MSRKLSQRRTGIEKGGNLKLINVLVTAVGGPTALGVLKCLRNVAGIRLIGVDSQSLTAGNQFCDVFYSIPRISNPKEYISVITKIVEKEKIDVVFPTLQDEISIYMELRNGIAANVALPKSDTFEVLVNKEKLYQHLEQSDLMQYVPRYHVFETGTELQRIAKQHFACEKCVCVKKVEGHGGLGFAVLTNRENYLRAIETGKSRVFNIDDYCDMKFNERRLIMEYLSGVEYSVDVLLHNGEVVVAVPRKRNRVSNGIVIDGIVEHNKEIIEAATIVSENVAHDGFINLQFIDSCNGYKLIDINARFCGSQVMSFGAGVNFPHLYIQYNLLNEPILVSPRWNTKMLRYWESCFFYD